jgi:multiple sugar transport system permease protein
MAIVLLFPMYWMISGSLQDSRGILAMPPKFFPTDPTLMNYERMLRYNWQTDNRLIRAFGNTVAVAAIAISLHIVVGFLAGYVFALYDFRFKQGLFWLFMLTMSMGRYQLIIPQYILMAKLGLVNTWLGVAMPLIFSPMTIFFFRNYLLAIPKAIVDCARIDGAGEMRILFRVLIPLCRPVVGVLSLFTGLGVSADYLWPSLIMQDAYKRLYFVEIIKRMRDATRVGFSGLQPIGLGLAGGTLLLIPMLLIFVFTSRAMIDGLNTGGLKE